MITKKFESKTELEDKLCADISQNLIDAIELNGYANMLVSGGSTPLGLYEKLSAVELSWKDVNIGLVDERFVSPTHEKSNEKMVRERLLMGNAKEAKFKGMVYDEESKTENLKLATFQYKIFERGVDVTILGMGGDGHTASLFPNDLSSKIGLSDKWADLLINTTADVEPTERISSSKFLIEKSKHLYLMMTGDKKMKVFSEAKEKEYPIASFIKTKLTELRVYFSA